MKSKIPAKFRIKFEKQFFLILFSAIILCGCSKKPVPSIATAGPPARDLIVAGCNVSWADGYNLCVAKRDGDSIKDIYITHKNPDGNVTTIAAKYGQIMPVVAVEKKDGVLVSTNAVSLILQYALVQGVSTQTIRELTLELHQ